MAMIPGAPINLGGATYIVPPINLRIDFAYKEQIKTICKPEGEVEFADFVDAASTVLYALMLRNYPEMTRDEFSDLIDVPYLRPIMAGTLEVSGYVSRPLAPKVMETIPPSPEPKSSEESTEPQDGSPTTSLND